MRDAKVHALQRLFFFDKKLDTLIFCKFLL